MREGEQEDDEAISGLGLLCCCCNAFVCKVTRQMDWNPGLKESNVCD